MHLIKAPTHAYILAQYLSFAHKVVVDVGCGTGDLLIWMREQGASAFGVDHLEILAKAKNDQTSKPRRYMAGSAEELPCKRDSADLLTYVASFHHVPQNKLSTALVECHRVLKNKGHAVFIEPVAARGSYYEVVRLDTDESQIQARAYDILLSATESRFLMTLERFYYLERSFADYIHLMTIFVADEERRNAILEQAKNITEGLCQETGSNLTDFRYRSICRINVLQKP